MVEDLALSWCGHHFDSPYSLLFLDDNNCGHLLLNSTDWLRSKQALSGLPLVFMLVDDKDWHSFHRNRQLFPVHEF